MSYLYNHQQFPDYVFNNTNLNYLFVPFNVVFENDFLLELKNFLQKHDISNITIENTEPNEFTFKQEVPVSKMPNSFSECVTAETIKTFNGSTISFYMLTDQSVIYTNEAPGLFAIVLDRHYWIGIIGLSNASDLHFFTQFAEQNMIGHLTANAANGRLTQQLKRKLKTNWR
jgi:hypothetical protein